MNSSQNELYEAPTTEVVEVKMENSILGTSNYRKHYYYEE